MTATIPHQAKVAGKHQPCPDARELTRRIYSRLADRDATVILFGSRGRGDHTGESDTDIIIQLDQNLPNWKWRREAKAINNILEKTTSRERNQVGGLDWAFAASWGPRIWRSSEERPFRGSADGLAFTTEEMAGVVPWELHGEPDPLGVPFHFLTPQLEGMFYCPVPGGEAILRCQYSQLDQPRMK